MKVIEIISHYLSTKQL